MTEATELAQISGVYSRMHKIKPHTDLTAKWAVEDSVSSATVDNTGGKILLPQTTIRHLAYGSNEDYPAGPVPVNGSLPCLLTPLVMRVTTLSGICGPFGFPPLRPHQQPTQGRSATTHQLASGYCDAHGLLWNLSLRSLI